MVIKSPIRVEGTEELMRKLGPERIKNPVQEAIKKITKFLMDTVRVSTPVDTARLRSNITSKVIGETGEVATNVEYAPFVEYGTVRMEARHVMMGTSRRIFGEGMFTYSIGQLRHHIDDFTKDLGDKIKVALRKD